MLKKRKHTKAKTAFRLTSISWQPVMSPDHIRLGMLDFGQSQSSFLNEFKQALQTKENQIWEL